MGTPVAVISGSNTTLDGSTIFREEDGTFSLNGNPVTVAQIKGLQNQGFLSVLDSAAPAAPQPQPQPIYVPTVVPSPTFGMSPLFQQPKYFLDKKRFKLLGAEVTIFTPDKQPLLWAKMKAFKLWEDIRVYDADKTQELLLIKQQKEYNLMHDVYQVSDSRTGQVLGAFKRQNLNSIVQDHWDVLDPAGNVMATLREDNIVLGLLRRLFANFVPQNYDLVMGETRVMDLKQRFSLFGFSYQLDGDLSGNTSFDPRMGIAAMVLLATIEGRQQ